MTVTASANLAAILTVEELIIGLDKPFLLEELVVGIHHAVSAAIYATVIPFLPMLFKKSLDGKKRFLFPTKTRMRPFIVDQNVRVFC